MFRCCCHLWTRDDYKCRTSQQSMPAEFRYKWQRRSQTQTSLSVRGQGQEEGQWLYPSILTACHKSRDEKTNCLSVFPTNTTHSGRVFPLARLNTLRVRRHQVGEPDDTWGVTESYPFCATLLLCLHTPHIHCVLRLSNSGVITSKMLQILPPPDKPHASFSRVAG